MDRICSRRRRIPGNRPLRRATATTVQQLDAPPGPVRRSARHRGHPPAADRHPHPPPPPVTARQHQSQHPRPLGGQHQPPPRGRADLPDFGDHPAHRAAPERFLHGPEHVVVPAQPRNDQQLPGPDPVAHQAGRVQVVPPGEPQEGATAERAPRCGASGRRVAPGFRTPHPRQQGRTKARGGFVAGHLVDPAQAQPAARERPVDPGDAQRQTRPVRRSGFLDAPDRPAERVRSHPFLLRQLRHGANTIPKKHRRVNAPPNI